MNAPKKPAESSFWPVVVPALCLALIAGVCIVVFGLPGNQDRRALGQDAPEGEAPEGMVWIPGGTFRMGSDHPAFKDAVPIHEVTIDGFWMDEHEVTNAQFAKFVDATGYKTVAEQKPTREEFPTVPEDKLVAGSIVFFPPRPGTESRGVGSWQHWITGASWKHPEGPKSDIKGRENHPVVHIAYPDAVAYCEWAGKRLPTEAEWEYASRGGLDQKPYVWGDELNPGGQWMANTWQGEFPSKNSRDDQHYRSAPVKSFAANGFGLYDMSGNVWEWCADWYRHDYYAKSPKLNPQGPEDSFDPVEARQGDPKAARNKRVQRGGSFLCADSYCIRYMNGGRGKGEVKSAHSHVGFRCAK